MITIVNHHSSYPSYFYITDTSDISNLPDCIVDSQAVNLTTGDVWVKCICSTDSTKKAWHKFRSSEEVIC